jgi:hypothetical protein
LSNRSGSLTAQLIEVQKLYRQQNKQPGIIRVLDSLVILREDQSSYPDKLNRIKSLFLQEISKVPSRSDNTDIKNALEAHLALLYARIFFFRVPKIFSYPLSRETRSGTPNLPNLPSAKGNMTSVVKNF